jgi:hypothetical protein
MRSNRVVLFLLLTCFYSLAFVVMTYPLAAHLGTRFVMDAADPRAMGDSGMFVWNLDNFAARVAAAEDPFATDRILYPVGANLWPHTYIPIAGLATYVFGSAIATLNGFVFLHFVVSGLGCYALARKFVEDRKLAALAGFAFSYCPYKLAHLLGHFNLELTATIPLFALCVVSFFRESPTAGMHRRGWVLGALVSFLLTAAADYYYTYYLLWFTLAYAGYHRYEDRILRLASRVRLWIVPVVVLSTIVTVVGKDVLDLETHGPFGYSADLLAYVLPSYDQRLAGGAALHAVRRALGIETIEHDIYVGVVVLAFVALYVAGRCFAGAPKERRALAFSGLVFLALSMPAVRVAGTRLGYLPSAFLHLVPLVNHARVPARFCIMVMLVGSILAMVAVEQKVVPRLGARGQRWLVALLLFALVVDFRRVDYCTTSYERVPAVYRALAERPSGTLLEIPFGIRDGLRQAGKERTSAMWFQLVHKKKLVGGMVARLPQRTFDWFRQEPIMADLLALEEARGPLPVVPPSSEGVAAFVERFDLKYILVAPEQRGTRLEAYVRECFGRLALSSESIDGYSLVTLDSSRLRVPASARMASGNAR